MELYDLFNHSKVSPEKIFYRIGEVSQILKVRPSVLRFWESEFSCRTAKTKANQRIYRKKDIALFLEIRRLLYEERYTIEGAKKRLKSRALHDGAGPSQDGAHKLLFELRNDLEGILKELKLSQA